MNNKELLKECKGQMAEQAKEEATYKEETITFNICDWKDAQDFANILIKNGHEVSIGPISSESVCAAKPIKVTIFGFHNKK